MASAKYVPVIYYHSVGRHTRQRPWSFLTCDIAVFKSQMLMLSLAGYYACTLSELENHLNGTITLPAKTVNIQFDDGFLDNLTVVKPIMEKFGFHYSIFATTEFVEDRNDIRPICASPGDENLQKWWGYLSTSELQYLDADPLVEIGVHGYSHTWLPCSNKVIDIHSASVFRPWLFWNDKVDHKPRWLSMPDEVREHGLGYPIFEVEKSIQNERAYIPSEFFVTECLRLFHENGPDLQSILDLARKLESEDRLGRFETEAELRDRITREVAGAKRYFEELLGREVPYLVWPGGGESSIANEVVCSSGIRLCSKGKELNQHGSKNSKISRMAGFVHFGPRFINVPANLLLLLIQLRRGVGSAIIEKLIVIVKRIIRKA